MYNFTKVINRVGKNSKKWNVDKGYISMTVADMDLAVAPEITEDIKKRLSHEVYGYDDLDEEYYNSIIFWYKKIHNVNLSKEWLLYATGVRPAINATIEALTKEGNSIVVCSPVYSYFFSNIQECKRNYIQCELILKDDYYINFEDLEQKLSYENVKMFIFCNPHNPLGRVWTKDEISRVAELCLKHHVILVSDEIHCDLTYKVENHVMSFSLSEEIANNTVTFIAPTKTFNIAGVRTSTIIIPNENLRDRVEKVLTKNKTNTNNFITGPATIAAYTKGEQWYKEVLEHLKGNRDFVKTFIGENIKDIKLTSTDATYLEWLDFSSLTNDSDEFCKFLEDNVKLKLTSGSGFGDGGEGKARLNFACTREVLEDAMQRLKKGVELYKNSL